jgi:hypothetical protein
MRLARRSVAVRVPMNLQQVPAARSRGDKTSQVDTSWNVVLAAASNKIKRDAQPPFTRRRKGLHLSSRVPGVPDQFVELPSEPQSYPVIFFLLPPDDEPARRPIARPNPTLVLRDVNVWLATLV